MKTIIIIGDGMSDDPIDRLGGRTPLMVADKPAMDRIAREGRVGLVRTIGPTGPSDSAVANLAVLGYDLSASTPGRAVFEAASMGIELDAGDVALRTNLIYMAGLPTDLCIRNHSAGHISSEEATHLISALDTALGSGRGAQPAAFYAGFSYRHLLVLHGDWASPAVDCAPPHDHLDERIADLLPRAATPDPAAEATAKRLRDLFREALPILAQHPVNRARRERGADEANAIWPWSPGRRPRMATLAERFGIRAAVISAVDLVKGLGVYAGMDVLRVPGATGLADTNYEGKAEACLDALADHDLVYVHVEATDEAAHARNLDLKIRCIEQLDHRLVKLVWDGCAARSIEAAIAVLPDHKTPVATGRHGRDPVPLALYQPGTPPDSVQIYDEREAERGALGVLEGEAFIRLALGMAGK